MPYTNFPNCQAIDMSGVPMCDRIATLGAPKGYGGRHGDPYVYCDQHRESYRGRPRDQHIELEWAQYAREAACSECEAACSLGSTQTYNPMAQNEVAKQRRAWRQGLKERCDDGRTVCRSEERNTHHG